MSHPARPSAFFLTLLLLALVGCEKKDASYRIREFAPVSIFDSIVDMTPAYAHGFRVTYLHDGTPLIDIADPEDSNAADTTRLALLRHGSSGDNVPAGYRRVRVPIRSAVCTDLSQISYFVGLDSLTILKGVPSPKGQHLGAIIRMLDSGDLQLTGSVTSPDIEAIARLKADVVFVSPPQAGDHRWSQARSMLIPIYASREPHPLGQAEWIKFFALLIGKESYGSDFFGKAEQHYNEARNSVLEVRRRPALLPVKKSDTGEVPIQTDGLMGKIVEDAGALPSQKTAGRQADRVPAVWQPEEGGGIGSFEETMPVSPDVIIRDLVSIVHPEVIPDDSVWVRQFFAPAR